VPFRLDAGLNMPTLARNEVFTVPVSSSDRERLKEIIAARSFRFGQLFRLVSGVESNVYFNMKPTMFDPGGSALMAKLVVERLARADVDAVGGLEMGAVPIVAAATMQSQLAGRPVQGFFVRKKAKEHGARLRIEGLAADETLKSKRVAIIDDVCTTGGSALAAIEEVREAGGEIVLVLAIVDREEGAEENFRQQGLAFDALFRAQEFIPEGFERLPPTRR
jgi:orotate phosphoribosyltransferase